jgi:integrase/recombinase XerD
MPYQFKREPLLPEEATRLAQACQTVREKLVIWTLLDTGLRVSELAGLGPAQIDWQGHRLTIYGKGGPYGSQFKRRIIPLSARVQPLIAHQRNWQNRRAGVLRSSSGGGLTPGSAASRPG